MTDTARLRELALAAKGWRFDGVIGGVGFVSDAKKQACHMVWGLPPLPDDAAAIVALIAACSPDAILSLIDKATATDAALATSEQRARELEAECKAWRAYYDALNPAPPVGDSDAMRDWGIKVGTLYAEAHRLRDENEAILREGVRST